MCILQDFEAITPNLLARTIETVEGGGLVILLLKTMSSLRQLYTMTMVCTCFRLIDNQAEDIVGRPFKIPNFRPRPGRGTIQRTVYPVSGFLR
jgi:tRNA(Met) C34 N-acetyltransferase TmcA